MDDHAAVIEALALAVAANVPVLLWGAPGTGKTTVVRQLAEQAGLPCETVIASIPVSYTHLDVYKRQSLDCARRPGSVLLR